MSQQPNLAEEQRLWAQGYSQIAGLDEAGRGAWAGPVVAAAVVLGPDTDALRYLAPVKDSKLLTARRRELCYGLVVQHALAYGVGGVSSDMIDRIGIVPATRLAMRAAIASLGLVPDYLLIDALSLDLDVPQKAIIKGDRYCLSIAAASVIAKVTRDRRMVVLDAVSPGYGLARHKGYGTQLHRRSLQHLGPAGFHRYSFAPIRALGEGEDV